MTLSIIGQVPKYQIHNYTIDDGLPSNECHHILQDSLGYIWIATDRGLVRYDGYSFKTYGPKQGLSNISCLDMAFDNEWNIYINTYGKQVFIYDRKTDSIFGYQFQKLIDNVDFDNQQIQDLYINKKGDCYFNITQFGVLQISQSGTVTLLNKDVTTRSYITMQVEDYLFTIFQCFYEGKELEKTHFIPPYSKFASLRYNIILDSLKIDPLFGPDDIMRYESKSFRLFDSIQLLSINGTNYLFSNTKEINRKIDHNFTDLAISKNGMIVSTHHNAGGTRFHLNVDHLISDTFETLLDDSYCTGITIDADDNIWITTLNNGIFLLRKHSFQAILSENSKMKSIASIATDGVSNIYVLSDKSKVWKYNTEEESLKAIYQDNHHLIYDLHYHDSLNQLIVSGHFSVYIDGRNNIHHLSYSYENIIYPFNITFSKTLKNNHILFGGRIHFIVGNNLTTEEYSEEVLRNIGFKANDILYLAGDNSVFATNDGIVEIHNKDTIRLTSIGPLSGQRVNCLDRTNDHHFIAGTNGKGIVLWNEQGSYKHLTTESGLISDNIEGIFIDKKQRIFSLSKQGFSVIELNQDASQIRNYTSQHGLPSNSVVDVKELTNGSYLIATEKGIVTWNGITAKDNTHIPILEKVKVNLKTRRDNEFTYHENSIEILYKSLDLKLSGNIEYRAKLNNGIWQYTKNTNSLFTALNPGSYHFKVQAKNRDGDWSESMVYNFTIAPPWWKSNWFYILLTISVVATLYALYHWRTNQIKKSFHIKHEINDLEKAALQAQMNPHFIFNCLNSIQSFIMDNNKEQAMDYLSRFAKLIRQNLNASVESKVSIENEVSMLDNYLALEKLRFKDKFDYHIHVDPQVHISSTFIPPLLIQPYVENAIIHGLKNVEEGGKVVVSIYRINDALSVDISDNGSGMSIDKIRSAKKSLGMSITQKRIEHNNKNDRIDLNISSNKDGVTVKLTIFPLNESQTL